MRSINSRLWSTESAAADKFLLQTEEYARTLRGCAIPSVHRDEIEKAVAVLREQQGVLTADPAPQLAFVLDESVLRRFVSVGDGYRVMRDQLRHLVTDCSGLPHLTLQVAPLNTPRLPGLTRSATLVETPTERLAFLEDQDGTATLVATPDATAAVAQHFGVLRSHALTPRQSLDLIKDIYEEL
jgi:Domain of unknown function (DUF5753)